MLERIIGSINLRSRNSFATIMINCVIAGTFAGIVFTLFLSALVIFLTTVG
jgi:hypothetical protein